MLFGAPERACCGNDEELTVSVLLPPFDTDILQCRASSHPPGDLDTVLPTASSILPVWRSIPPEHGPLTTGFSQRQWLQVDLTPRRHSSFKTASSAGERIGSSNDLDVSSAEDDDSRSYLAQSLALHTFTDSPITPLQPRGPTVSPVVPLLTHLTAIPTAAALQRLAPQTSTIDIVVGIISIESARAITVRARHSMPEKEVSLVEILVGDDTRAGFKISVWGASADCDSSATSPAVEFRSRHDKECVLEYPASELTGPPRTLQAMLSTLRVADVVLLRNVALTSFRGVVHGQTLARRGLGWSCDTTAQLLWRHKTVKRRRQIDNHAPIYDSDDLDHEESTSAVTRKSTKVRTWVKRFVGVGNMANNGLKRKRDIEALCLPPDETPG
ncbi:hypothetical protein MRB53_037947 [Persea americana]|nr:hypothetical protein MRB53_037947 [Persea americana]